MDPYAVPDDMCQECYGITFRENWNPCFQHAKTQAQWDAACRWAIEAGKRVPADKVDTALAHAALQDRPAHDLKPLAKEATDRA